MSVYERLGVRPIINANTSLTRLGGTLMDPAVLAAMASAAASFVDMWELHEAVSARLAELTHNEDALVCGGAASGLVLATLASMTGRDLGLISKLIEGGPGAIGRDTVLMQRGHRMPYDPAVRLAGARIVEVGNVLQTFDWQLEAAIDQRTAAILHVEGRFLPNGQLPLERVAEIARTAGVPVIVDAAAQQLPRENLWRFTAAGAAMAVFSGGKGLRGPQSSGLIVGRAEWVRACAMHAAPYQRLARAMKVGKEEIVGLLVAVERFMAADVEADLARNDRVLDEWADELASVPDVVVVREPYNAGGQPIPRLRVEVAPPLAIGGPAIRDAMRSGEPRIDVEVAGPAGIYLAAECLGADEGPAVIRRLVEVLGHASREV